MVATGTPDELKAKAGSQVLRVAPADPARMAEVTALMSGLIRTEAAIDAGRDDTPGVQGQQRQQNPQLTAAGMNRTPRLVPQLRRTQ